MFVFKNNRFAFTLSEALITLTVIGVVASLTLSPMIKRYQNEANIAKLKKTYIDFATGFRDVLYSYDCGPDLGCTELFDGGDSAHLTQIVQELAKVMKIPKTCDYVFNSSSACFKRPSYLSSSDLIGVYGVSGITLNGVSFMVDDQFAANCNIKCGTILLDVNGTQSPNKMGRDVFMFYILPDARLFPVGGEYDIPTSRWDSDGDHSCRTDISSGGDACAARVIQHGWKIDY